MMPYSIVLLWYILLPFFLKYFDSSGSLLSLSNSFCSISFPILGIIPGITRFVASKNESSTEAQVDLPKLPSDFISKNESSAALDNVPMPDKFNPLFHNSGPIENTIVCDISVLNDGRVICQGTVKNDKIVGTSKSDEINSLEGDDFILGDDFLFGGEGGDQINGGSGDGSIGGGNGEDLI